MTNQDKAAQTIYHLVKNHLDLENNLSKTVATRIAQILCKENLLALDPPDPDISLPSGEQEWHAIDGYVNLHGGEITVSYDERDEDTYLTEPAPEPGEIRITDTTQGRAVAYAILAACEYKDAQDE